MINFTNTETMLSVKFNERSFFAFSKEKPFMWIGCGTAEYPMSRGSFKFKEKTQMKTPLFIDTASGELLLKTKDGKAVLRLELEALDNRLHAHFEVLDGAPYNRMWLRLSALNEECVYGCGETFTAFNLRGESVKIWVAEHQNAKRFVKKVISDKLAGVNAKRALDFSQYATYYAQPTFMSSRKYFVHIDTTDYAEFDFTARFCHTLFVKDLADVYIGFADSFEELSTNLSDLLGRQPRLPEWAYDGAILGIQGGTEIVDKKLKKAKEYKMKVAGVWCQDWEGARITQFGKQLVWNWEWDKKLYPNLDTKILGYKKDGIRFLGYCNPFLAIEKGLYKYASEKGYCVKNKDGEDYLVKITTFPAAMVDLTNPDAYNWIKSVIKDNMIAFGLGGWMADFGEYLPTDCVLYSGDSAEKIHNTWPAIWAKINREALEETGKIGDIFFFTRAGNTETIKYSTLMWNGDQHVDWSYDDGLPSVIPATLSLAVSGFGLTHSDVGGYTTFMYVKRTPELLMRWAEMNAFSPLFRSHEGNRPDDNVHFDSSEEILKHYAKMSRIHAGLKDYLMAADKLNSTEGIPVIRPLFYYYHSEKDFREQYEYLLGRDILVAPVIEQGQPLKKVYLPEDEWVHLWTGEVYNGGEHSISAGIGYPPVFCRKGSKFLKKFLKLKDA